MQVERFIVVGENIHCTRIYKVGGAFVGEDGRGGWNIGFRGPDGPTRLPVPPVFTEGADWSNGKVKHCAVAIWQGNYGDAAGRAAGVAYLRGMAREQAALGAAYLDVNVDEFSTDVEERVCLMRWTVDVLQQAVAIPVSVDSSNLDILRAGLDAADRGRGKPMINSVSLERTDAIDLAAGGRAVVIASAAGEGGMPAGAEGRLTNLAALMPRLREAGLADADIHIDPLVFPISVNGAHGVDFFDAVAGVRGAYGPDVHIVAGLSNVSFGMPQRKLINQVFTWMAVERGADGGIVNPREINRAILNGLDPSGAPFGLAKALLLGEDEYGMAFLAASRDGTI